MPIERDEVHPFWLRGYEAGAAEVQAELLAAQEREKALREALEAIRDWQPFSGSIFGEPAAGKVMRGMAKSALAASPSERFDG